jgi:hypothetical protein
MNRIAYTVAASVGALFIFILSFAVGESMGVGEAKKEFSPTEKELQTCKTDLEASRKEAFDSWTLVQKWSSLVGDFADQQRVTRKLVEQKFGITPEMIEAAVAKDKADAGKP